MYKTDTSHFTANTFSAFLKDRLRAYYPAGVPDFAEKRLDAELPILSEALDEFLLYDALSKTAERTGHILQVAGVSIGSILVFLLGNSLINPLPAHYYCTHCGSNELSDDAVFGMDLPKKVCPNCGHTFRRDGFSLPSETLWKRQVSIEYRVSDGFYPFALQTVKNFFAERGHICLPLGANLDDEDIQLLTQIGVAVLPPKKTAEDFPHLQSFLKDGTPCLTGPRFHFRYADIQRILITVSNLPDAIYRVQAKSGMLASAISLEELIGIAAMNIISTGFVDRAERARFNFVEPDYYYLAQELTFPHNSYVDENKKRLSKQDARALDAFTEYPLFFPEEVFDVLVANGASRETAMHAAEAVHMGCGVYRPEQLEAFGLPPKLLECAKHCSYLFPRASGAQWLVSLLMLTKYMKDDPKTYFTAIGEIK